MCTGMIAFVRGVIAASTAAGSTLNVRSSISANTGFARSNRITLADATNEKLDVITSSPGPTPRRCRATCSPAVPLEQATACCAPTRSANARSNAGPTGPQARLSDRSTSRTSSSSRPSRYGRASGIERVVTTALDGRADRVLEQVGEALVLPADDGEERVLDLLRDRAARAGRMIVDRRHRRHLRSRAAEEHLVAEVEVGAHQVHLAHLVAERVGDPHHRLAGDPGQARRGRRRRVEHPVPDDEHVLARAVGDVALL